MVRVQQVVGHVRVPVRTRHLEGGGARVGLGRGVEEGGLGREGWGREEG